MVKNWINLWLENYISKSVETFFICIVSEMPLAVDNETLAIYAFVPSVSPPFVDLCYFFDEHSFDLGMHFSSDHHEVLFGDIDALYWEGVSIIKTFVYPIREDDLVGIDLIKASLINFGIKIGIYPGLKIQVEEFQ